MALSNLTRAAAKALRKQRTPATAILVAAGSATRMGGIDKVMAALAGRPLLAHSMLAFQQCVQISGIIVVTRQELCSSVEEMARQYGASKLLAVVPGGATRTESVQAGLAQVPADSRLVAVHDAARPLVSQSVIYAALQAAAETGAAAPALPVKDTIKVASGGVVVATPERAKLFAVQTPQCFDRDLLSAALVQPDGVWTDDCAALEQLGVRVRLTPGEERNFKVTTPLDLQLARLLVAEENEHNKE